MLASIFGQDRTGKNFRFFSLNFSILPAQVFEVKSVCRDLRAFLVSAKTFD